LGATPEDAATLPPYRAGLDLPIRGTRSLQPRHEVGGDGKVKRMSARKIGLLAATGLALAGPAAAMVGEDYDPGRDLVTSTWYGAASPAAMQADRAYVAGMRRHHAGALSMSEEYLADAQASSPFLRQFAQAIIRNQRYEIGLLDEVSRNLEKPPVTLNLGLFRLTMQPGATEGLGQFQGFQKSPLPLLAARGPVTARDVQFAKAMTIHHQGALDMARAYNANPEARNRFLRLLNLDIITDQTQEIALMRTAVGAYPGDSASVQVDPSMVHGMEGMGHGTAPAEAHQDHDGHGAHQHH
jgi:uncharacterized protein (DUF305 family)